MKIRIALDLLTSGRLNDYWADIGEQAQGITVQLLDGGKQV